MKGQLRFSRQTATIALDGVAVNIALETKDAAISYQHAHAGARHVLNTVILSPAAQIAKLDCCAIPASKWRITFIDLQLAGDGWACAGRRRLPMNCC